MTQHPSHQQGRLDAVRRVIEELTGVPVAANAAPDARLTDLGISSLMLFQFVTRLEEVSGVAIPDTALDARNFRTLGSTCSVLERSAS